MQLEFGDAYPRQREDAARLEGMPLAKFAAQVTDAVERVTTDPRIGDLLQVDLASVTRTAAIGQTAHVLVYLLAKGGVLRVLGIVELSALPALRTRVELVIPDQLEPYVAELRHDDDQTLQRKQQHWADRRERISRGGMGDDPDHRALLLRGVALFDEGIAAEQLRRSR